MTDSRVSVNIGVMGHVDAGKTSLLRALAREVGGVVSTAGLDKHPQSQERGITIDLGFTSLELDLPNGSIARICFVDCPGHSSLIKAVMGAARIVDRLVLVIDATKGIQAQTAECLIIAEILCPHLVVVLNKIDLIPETERSKKIDLLCKRLRSAVFSKTSFGANVPVIAMAAAPTDHNPDGPSTHPLSVGLSEFLAGLRESIISDPPRRNSSGPLLFLFDHAFLKKGHGTIVTGTVVSGSIRRDQVVCLSTSPSEKRRVRSIQSFKEPIDVLYQGDRGGICVTGVDSTNLERGLIMDPSCPLPTMNSFVAAVRRIPQFKQTITSRAKFHITVAHSTVTAICHFFASPDVDSSSTVSQPQSDERGIGLASSHLHSVFPTSINSSIRYRDLAELPTAVPDGKAKVFYGLIYIDHKQTVTCPQGSVFIASRLDADNCGGACRLAFYGQVLCPFIQSEDPNSTNSGIRQRDLFIAKEKQKRGQVDRWVDARSVIGKKMFSSSTHVEKFVGLRVGVEGMNRIGIIERPFGKSGKFAITFKEDVTEDIEGKPLVLVYDVNVLDAKREKWNVIQKP